MAYRAGRGRLAEGLSTRAGSPADGKLVGGAGGVVAGGGAAAGAAATALGAFLFTTLAQLLGSAGTAVSVTSIIEDRLASGFLPI